MGLWKKPWLPGRTRCVVWVGGLIMMMVVAGCYTQKIERAFDGEFQAYENNRIINEYCLSCHIHRDFNSTAHVEEVSLNYNRKVFRYATECRVCHFIEKHWDLNDFQRKTRRPREVNQGIYEDFEQDYLEYQQETAQDLPDSPS